MTKSSMTTPTNDSYLNKFLSMIRSTSPIKTSGKLISFAEQGLLTEKEASLVSGMTIHTLRKRRLLKQPPEYIKIDRRVYYKNTDLEKYLGLKITSENTDNGE